MAVYEATESMFSVEPNEHKQARDVQGDPVRAHGTGRRGSSSALLLLASLTPPAQRLSHISSHGNPF